MKLCVVCRREESDHHNFVGEQRPNAQCKCDAMTWGDPRNIPLVCAEFSEMVGDDSYCATCEHDASCHPSTKPATTEEGSR